MRCMRIVRSWWFSALILAGALTLVPANGQAHFSKSKKGGVTQKVSRPEGYARVVDHLRAWDLQGAERRLAQAEKRAPRLPDWEALRGAVAYLRGNYRKSIERLNTALSRRPGDREWLELRLHVRQTLAGVAGFRLHRTKHFEIRYDPGADAILLGYLEKALERAYEVLGEEFGFHPKAPVRVEVFSDPIRFHKASTLSRRDIEETGAVGLCKFNKVMMLSPGALLKGYRWLDTVVHEYVHYLIVRTSKNGTPIWLHEGIAKMLENRWRGENLPFLGPTGETLLSRARARNTFVGFKRMEPSLIYLDNPMQVQQAYAEAASAAEYLRRRLGRGGLSRLMKAIGAAEAIVPPTAPKDKTGKSEKGESGTPPPRRRASLVELEASGRVQTAEPGLKALLGVDLEGFQKLWKNDLKLRKLRAEPGARPRKFRLKPKGPMDERTSDLVAVKNMVARRRTRLADRLLIRGRFRAALTEYRRALRDEPNSVILLNRLARVAIRLGKIRMALAHLKRAIEIDPDSGTAYIYLGLAYEHLRNAKEAQNAWEQAIQINPFNSLPHVRLAALYAQAGDARGARRELELARQLMGR